MTFSERNQIIKNAMQYFEQLHEKYTSSVQLLTDEEWENYIKEMDSFLEAHKGSNLEGILWKLCQAFLDDTEMVQKKLRG